MKKIILFSSLCLILVGCSASPTKPIASPTAAVHQKTTKTGTLTPLASSTGDATHQLKTATGTVFVNSYSVDLKQFNSKKVTVIGEFSGTTLFADTVTEAK